MSVIMAVIYNISRHVALKTVIRRVLIMLWVAPR